MLTWISLPMAYGVVAMKEILWICVCSTLMHLATNKNTPLQSAYRTHEKMKKRAYQQRVLEIEHASFTPVVLSASGGMANEATFVLQENCFTSCTEMGPALQLTFFFSPLNISSCLCIIFIYLKSIYHLYFYTPPPFCLFQQNKNKNK